MSLFKKEVHLSQEELDARCAICGAPRGYHSADDDSCPLEHPNDRESLWYHATNKFKAKEGK